jgi:hypothetical protein
VIFGQGIISSHTNVNTTTSIGPLTLTTTVANTVIIALISVPSGDTVHIPAVSSVTDSMGLVWVKRGGVNWTFPTTTSPSLGETIPASNFDMEYWWANAPTAGAYDVTATLVNTTVDSTTIQLIGIPGTNFTAPWDTNSSLPVTGAASAMMNLLELSGVSTLSFTPLLFSAVGGAGGFVGSTEVNNYFESPAFTPITQSQAQFSATTAFVRSAFGLPNTALMDSTQVMIGAGPALLPPNPGGTNALILDALIPLPPVGPFVSNVSPSAGPLSGGSLVQIAGGHFTGATAVDFGATPAPDFSVSTDNLIQVATPAGAAGTVDVTVTGPLGTSALSLGDQFTYVLPPIAGPTSILVQASSSPVVVPIVLSGGPAASLAVVVPPANGTITINGLVLTYTPTFGLSGADSFSYSATNAAGTSAPALVSVLVVTPTFSIVPTTLPTTVVNELYIQQLFLAGGLEHLSGVTVLSGTLPVGLNLSPAGLLSGVPKETGAFSFVVSGSVDVLPLPAGFSPTTISLRILPDVLPPSISLRWSDTKGQDWGNPVLQSVGKQGAFLTNVQWRRLGMARDRVYEVTWSLNGEVALNGAFVEFESAET